MIVKPASSAYPVANYEVPDISKASRRKVKGFEVGDESLCSVTHDRYEHGIFPVCIGHRNRVVNSRQVGSYAVMRARGLEHHESHEKHHDAGECRHVEALGIEIDKHISPDFLTIFVQQKIHHGRLEPRLKTANGNRQVDLHPTIAALFKEFVGNRASGFLFCTQQGRPLSPSNIIRRHPPRLAPDFCSAGPAIKC